MERHAVVGQHEVRVEVLDEVHGLWVFAVEGVDDGAFDLLEAEDLLGDLHVEDPVHKGNVVTRVQAVPERTYQHSSQLRVELPSSLLLLVGVIRRIVDVFVDVSAKGDNSADVPVIGLDLEARVEVKLVHVVHLYLPEIIRDRVVLIGLVLGRIVGDSRGPHADHAQAPSSHILELNMGDCCEWV